MENTRVNLYKKMKMSYNIVKKVLEKKKKTEEKFIQRNKKLFCPTKVAIFDVTRREIATFLCYYVEVSVV